MNIDLEGFNKTIQARRGSSSAASYSLFLYEGYYERAAMAGDPSTSGNSCAITKEAIKQSLLNHGFGDVNIKTSGNGWATWMENELEDGVLFFNYRGYLGMSGFSTSNVDNASRGWKLPFATVLTCSGGNPSTICNFRKLFIFLY